MPSVSGVAAPDRVLMRAGVLLFLIGLLTGFAVPMLHLPRMGLASHLVGTMSGMFLIVLGLVWPRLVLPAWAGTITFWAALYGSFANWLATILSAKWGAAAMMPIAGGGATSTPLAEGIVAALLISLSLAMILVCVLVLWGLRPTQLR
ncbi:MAG: hydrogenase [Alphaproteobacteria bacterium]|nr:hydrogenase [Alphaproteobacteria bacterium]